MTARKRVHEPGCKGSLECGGWYRCRVCGKRCGWCRGESWDEETCPECWQGPPQPLPEMRFRSQVASIHRDSNGRFVSQVEQTKPKKNKGIPLSGLIDKLYWRQPGGKGPWHCFKKSRDKEWTSLCERFVRDGTIGGGDCRRPHPLFRCGLCDGREMARRKWTESGPTQHFELTDEIKPNTRGD